MPPATIQCRGRIPGRPTNADRPRVFIHPIRWRPEDFFVITARVELVHELDAALACALTLFSLDQRQFESRIDGCLVCGRVCGGGADANLGIERNLPENRGD